MKSNKIIRVIAFLLLFSWMILIFAMSAQHANESSQTSGRFVLKVINVLYSDFENFSVEKQGNITNTLTFIVRKTAHFLEYFVLGALSAIVAFTFKKGSAFQKTIGAIIFAVLYAVSDEVHQYFVPGRACRFFDICVDALGCICAVILIAIVISAKRRKLGEFNAKKEID